ncbi:MAG: hypothetical protein ACI9B9_000870 [Halioglobus sp.]
MYLRNISKLYRAADFNAEIIETDLLAAHLATYPPGVESITTALLFRLKSKQKTPAPVGRASKFSVGHIERML